MFLDFAEDRARRRQTILMAEWVNQADRFLSFNERAVLAGTGRVSADEARNIVGDRYAAFDAGRRSVERVQAEEQELEDLSELVALEGRADARHGGGNGFADDQ